MYIEGDLYSYPQTIACFGGGDRSYLPTRGGIILGGRFKPKMNPRAPDVVVVGNNPQVVEKANALGKGGYAIPVFVWERSNKWRYKGMYKCIEHSKDAVVISSNDAGRPDIDSILFLEYVPAS